MDFDVDEVNELIDMLEVIVEDVPSKIREDLGKVIKSLKQAQTLDDLLKVQDELESLTSTHNLDSFSRSEIMNVVASIESIVNS